MSFYSFVLSACNGRFDARHVMVAGGCALAAISFSTSLEGLKAKTVAASGVTAQIAMVDLPLVKPDTVSYHLAALDTKTMPVFAANTPLTLFNARKVSEAAPLTRVSDLKINASLIEDSVKDKKSCSADAAHAAANGDTSKISPCIADLLSGDEEKIKNMPANMAKFFIETMSDPNAAENAPQIMINSMMAMMEAMSSQSTTPKETSSTK